MREMEKVSSDVDARIRRNMLNVLERVRREIRKVVAESPEPSVSSGYCSASTNSADSSPPMVITPDPEPFRDESPKSLELRATPSPPLAPSAERRAESPRESTSQDRDAVSLDVSSFEEEEEGSIFEVLAQHAEQRGSRDFDLLSRYLLALLNRRERDRTGEAVDSGEGQGEGSSSQEDPPPPEDSAESSSQGSQSASTPSPPGSSTGSGDQLRSASRRARRSTSASRPAGLPPRAPRSASSHSQTSPIVPRHSSASPSRHDRVRSSPVDSRSRSPLEPFVSPSLRPERLSSAPGPRSSRTGRLSDGRPDTPLTIPRSTAEEEEEPMNRRPGPLFVGPPQVPALQMQPHLSSEEGFPDSARSKSSESDYETATDDSARSSGGDTGRTMIPREEFEQRKTENPRMYEEFSAKYSGKKPPRRDDDDHHTFKTARETQPSDQDPAPN